MADEFKELPNDQVEIISKIPFPGIIVKSVTVLDIAKDLEAPKFEISTVSSETVCDTGPRWVRDLLVRLLGATKSTSDNQVTVAARRRWRAIASARRAADRDQLPRPATAASGAARARGLQVAAGRAGPADGSGTSKFRSDYPPSGAATLVDRCDRACVEVNGSTTFLAATKK